MLSYWVKRLSETTNLNISFANAVHLSSHVSAVEYHISRGKEVDRGGERDFSEEAVIHVFEERDVAEQISTLLHTHILTHTLWHVVYQALPTWHCLAPAISNN